MTDFSDTLDAANAAKHAMIHRTTTGGMDKPKWHGAEYVAARRVVLADPIGKRLAPESLKRCRDLSEVWSYVKAHFLGLDTYESRRNFFRDEFDPLLTALEEGSGAPHDDLVSGEAQKLDAEAVQAAWSKALDRREADPEGAITAARTLLESTLKTVLDDRQILYKQGADLPVLWKLVQDALDLAPSEQTETQFKAILSACTTVVKELGSLRNKASDSHGSGRKSYKPAARHAALAVNLAGSMAQFIIATHEERGGLSAPLPPDW